MKEGKGEEYKGRKEHGGRKEERNIKEGRKKGILRKEGRKEEGGRKEGRKVQKEGMLKRKGGSAGRNEGIKKGSEGRKEERKELPLLQKGLGVRLVLAQCCKEGS